MFTCKQVSHTLSEEDYAKLPPMKRFSLKLHVKLCIFCGKFNRQVMDTQDMCRCYKSREDEFIGKKGHLQEDKKAQLRTLLAQQSREE